MSVVTSGIGGSSMYENGYNVQIPGNRYCCNRKSSRRLYSEYMDLEMQMEVFLAQEEVVVDLYSKLSLTLTKPQDNVYLLALLLINSGRDYIVGDNVSIVGTYLGGATPANNLTFPVTKTTGSRVGIETTYTSIPSTNDGGSGATFNVTGDAGIRHFWCECCYWRNWICNSQILSLLQGHT